MGLNATLATARQSLDVFSTGIQVAGQNIANASTPGYIREELQLETGITYRSGSLVLGTGVVAAGVQQQIDQFLEQRIHSANAEVSTATVKETIFKQLEGEIQELGEADLSTALTDFTDALQELATQPESVSFRELVINEGTNLTRDIRSLYYRVDDIRHSKSSQIRDLVAEANSLIEQIDQLNAKIVDLELAGHSPSDAGAARSERYEAMTRLSEIIPIRYREQPTGAVDVFAESHYLILGNTTQELVIRTTGPNIDEFRIELSASGHDIARAGGELRGVIAGRDEILSGFLDQLDQFASTLISQFNQHHSSGEGLQGYSSVTSGNLVSNSAVPLNQESSGLSFAPQHGSFEIKIVNQQTGIAETTTIPVDLDGTGTDASFEDIRIALDGIANLTATISPKGELQIDATSGYEFRFANDTSGLLASLGVNTFFSGTNAGDIDISESLRTNSNLLATSQGGGPSDGRNLVGLLDFLDQPAVELNELSLNGFYEQAISQVAQNSASESALAKGFSTFRESLRSQQQQFIGVSLDEEAIKVLELQRGYQAAARIVSTVNELFAVLLNL